MMDPGMMGLGVDPSALGMAIGGMDQPGYVNDSTASSDNQAAKYAPKVISIPDTLTDSLANANKHLLLIARKMEPIDIESVMPQIQSMQSLMQVIMQDEEGEGNGS